MWLIMKVFLLQILAFLVFGGGIHCQASTRRLTFVVNTIYDSGLNATVVIMIFREWHGVTMPRYPWTDGPEYITQCPIRPGSKFTQKIILSTEEGTLWWHAHREWWKNDVNAVRDEGLATGGDPDPSDALLINGQPGDLYPCSNQLNAKKDEYSYEDVISIQLSLSNCRHIQANGGSWKDLSTSHNHAALQEALFFSIDKHKMTVVGTDAIVQYSGYYTPSSPPSLPYLPAYNDTNASVQVMAGLRSLANAEHPCNGPMGRDSPQVINNISFHTPTVDILQAYYYNISGVYGDKFPSDPPLVFDFTADYLPLIYQLPSSGTEVRVLEYNSTVEIVFQGQMCLQRHTTPMHLHGYSFYVVGWGFGNFDGNKDPLRYNLVDPPFQNTISVPSNGWVAIRFEASNPGMSVVHALPCRTSSDLGHGNCVHSENGKHPEAQMLPPPSTCHHVEAAKK
ncbi:Laccase-14 [Vitis vinifera]|uniref:Laccase-14 n=1 Tax=Vitis vinifera TaxID=29760 RepID=A0A438ECG6_VITVI|nr:Laccase-14 [Vitis vinifera]